MLDFFKKKGPENANNPLNQQDRVRQPGQEVQAKNPTLNTTNPASASQQSVVVEKSESTLNPPKNLPDLAKDLFGSDQSNNKSHAELESYDKALKESAKLAPPASIPSRIPAEPSKISVPQLDISLVKKYTPNQTENRIANENLILQSFNITHSQTTSQPDQVKLKEQSQRSSDYIKERLAPAFNNNNISLPISTNLSSQTSFFLDFEKYVLAGYGNSNAGNAVINELLTSNLLEKMRNYHPSGAESDLVTQKFNELAELERMWTLSKQKIDSARLFEESIEADILYKSEKLKKQLSGKDNMPPSRAPASSPENRRMPLDFFHILKKKENVVNPDNNNTNIIMNAGEPISATVKINDYQLTDPAKYFYTKDGVAVRSIRELISVIARMPDETFYHHVSYQRNDFANWIRDIYRQPEVANTILIMISRKELLDFLLKNMS